jgi:hypothetical protein
MRMMSWPSKSPVRPRNFFSPASCIRRDLGELPVANGPTGQGPGGFTNILLAVVSGAEGE